MITSTRNNLLSAAFLVIQCLVFSTSLRATSLDHLNSVPVPLGTALDIVSADTRQNGAPTVIATYSSSLSLTETLAFYQEVWPNEPDAKLPGSLASRLGEWLLISRLRDGINTVIQLKLNEPFRSHGFLSVSTVDLSNTEPTGLNPSKDSRHDAAYVELSKTHSKDGPLSSTVQVLQSNQSLSLFIESLIRQRTDDGWALSSQKQYQGSHIMFMNKQRHNVEIVVSSGAQGKALAVVNEVLYEKH